jgi:hypothetical protein
LKLLHNKSINKTFDLLPADYCGLQSKIAHAVANSEANVGASIRDSEVTRFTVDMSLFSLQDCVMVKRNNVLSVVMKLLFDPDLCHPDNLIWKSQRLWVPFEEARPLARNECGPVHMVRAYGHDCTGTWWEHLEKHHLKPGCLPLILKVFSDSTLTGKNPSAHPVMITLSSFIGNGLLLNYTYALVIFYIIR